MLAFYNTLHKSKEAFTPQHPGKVSIYTCGPTVYDYIHIGNIRSYITSDLINRYVTYRGYEVRLIKNITDVGHLTDDDVAQGDSGEDKMLKKARLEKKDPYEIARFYENAAKEDEKELGILPAHYYPRATEHIPQMIAMIETLITKGHAYEANGNVFLDVTTFADYGTLSGNTLDTLKVGARLSEPHPDKKNQWDFALWLKAGDEHLMKWDSPWSLGYPGWHIECSAMSTAYLGDTIDIHTGGEDNIFPHHEAEIAQTECTTDKKFVNYWVHTRHLLVDGKKMSKSKGNGYTLAQVKEKGFHAMDLRMLYLLSHYRSQMNFTWEALTQAHKNYETLTRLATRLASASEGTQEIDVDYYKAQFEQAMDDDLNTPLALTILLALTTTCNRALDGDGIANAQSVTTFFTRAVTDVLGLHLTTQKTDIPQDITHLAEKRLATRAAKDFAASDALRDAIAEKGYLIEDTSDGYTLTKK